MCVSVSDYIWNIALVYGPEKETVFIGSHNTNFWLLCYFDCQAE